MIALMLLLLSGAGEPVSVSDASAVLVEMQRDGQRERRMESPQDRGHERDHGDRGRPGHPRHDRRHDRDGRRYDRPDRHDRRHHRMDHGRRGHRHAPPPWARSYWGPRDRHYVAMIPGDNTRAYFLIEGRWVLKHITDPRWRIDIQNSFSLPLAAPPPVPPPPGISFHIVLFD